MSSQGVIDVEDRQAPKRNGSRYNAVKHGLTAKTAVLPGEDADEFQAKIDSYKECLETRNRVEDELAERAAQASWQLDRANNAEVARLTRDMLTKPAAAELRAELEAVALGHRLYHDRRGPTEVYPSRGYDKQEPRTSWDENPQDPDHPAKLIPQLEATLAGCRVLLKLWGELRSVLELGSCWLPHEKLKCTRLLGRQPINAAGVREVAEVFLACHAVKPRYACAFQELRCEIHEDRFKRHKADLDRWRHAGITPADAKAGRAVLMRIVDEATARLRMLEAKHQKLADLLAGLETKLLSFDESKAGDQLRRHEGSCNRLMLRNIEAIRKGHRDEARGWGKTRKERERTKEARRDPNQLDERLVLDEQGNVRIAEEYDGDIEEGIARYERELGYGTPRPRRAIVKEVVPPVVPDYARWKPPVVDGDEQAGNNFPTSFLQKNDDGWPGQSEAYPGGDRPRIPGHASLCPGHTEAGSSGSDYVPVPELPREEGGGRANGGGAEETYGQGDGGVGDPRRTEGTGDGGVGDRRRTDADGGVGSARRTDDDGAPLMLTEEGERANIQNEIGEGGVADGSRVATEGATGEGAVEAPQRCSQDRVVGEMRSRQGSKQDERQMRREMFRREMERRVKGKWTGGDTPVRELIKEIRGSAPSVTPIVRPSLPRSP